MRGLRGLAATPLVLLCGCATGVFSISPQAQLEAEETANMIDMGRASAEGLEGTWLTHDWGAAICHWSRTEPAVAVCRTDMRLSPSHPWRRVTQRYRRGGDGAWEALP